MSHEPYPTLKAAMADGRVKPTDPPERKLRCGPWDKQEDGSSVCRKCGDVEVPGPSGGPFGF
jgi:hypothetical protein